MLFYISYIAYLSEDKNFFANFISKFYKLGQEHDVQITRNSKDAAKEQYIELLVYYKNKSKNGTIISLKNRNIINNLYAQRQQLLDNIGLEEYGINLFNTDLQMWYGLNLIQGNNTQLSLERDYSLLISSQMTSQFTDDEWRSFGCTTNEERKKYLKTLYGNIFNNIFNMLRNSSEARTNFAIIKDQIASRFNTSGVTNVRFAENSSSIVESGGEIVKGYSNSIIWMFELYRNYNSDGTAFNFGAVDGYTNQGINNTFFQYYLGQDRNRLTEPGRLLENKTINVKDTNETNGVCNTHFIANIDFLITLFTDIKNGVENVNENRSWTTMDWYEGFRTLAEGGSVGNGHTLNKAVDFLNIQVTNANGGSEYMTARQQYDLIKYFRDTGHYRWKEWKKGDDENDTDANTWAGGYHLGLIGNDICVFGSTKEDSEEIMKILLQSLGITKNLNSYFTSSNGWCIINFDAIDNFLNQMK